MVHTLKKRGEVTVTSDNSEESENERLPSEFGSDDEDAGEEDSQNSPESPDAGNPCWADAIANVLGTKKPKNKRTVILAKAKKDIDYKLKKEEKSFDIVDSEGKVQGVEVVTKVKKRKKSTTGYEVDDDDSSGEEHISRLDLQKRRNKKLLWEGMCRVKPSPLHKDRERKLAQIATKGVVQLFNAVRQHQKKLDTSLKSAGNSEVKQEKVMKSVSKGAFLDLLKGCPSQNVSDSTKVKEREKKDFSEVSTDKGWSVLKDDFLLGASLKDWDKAEAAQS